MFDAHVLYKYRYVGAMTHVEKPKKHSWNPVLFQKSLKSSDPYDKHLCLLSHLSTPTESTFYAVCVSRQCEGGRDDLIPGSEAHRSGSPAKLDLHK